MQRDLFHYDLPPELIAQQPPGARRDARLLTLDGASGEFADRRIPDLPALIEPGDLLVFNDTRVIAARLFGSKDSGGKVEVLIERMIGERDVLAHVRASKAPRVGSVLTIGGRYRFELVARERDLFRLRVGPGTTIADVVQEVGHVPLPPYIDRSDTPVDGERYQTIYSRVPGAVAAPTAGLHFDAELLRQLAERGVDSGFVTLHVGAGTFQPVRAARVEDHHMHSEYCEVPDDVCTQIERARAAGRRIIAVGTTSVRALESASRSGGLQPYRGETDIFIYPGYRFRTVDTMLTNFHLPESTLLMLVSAFAGRDKVLAAYRHAIRERYRFFSYGDAMWITRGA